MGKLVLAPLVALLLSGQFRSHPKEEGPELPPPPARTAKKVSPQLDGAPTTKGREELSSPEGDSADTFLTSMGWGSIGYMLWRTRSAPLPIPVVTTSTDGGFGILGSPGTRVLFGGNKMDHDSQHGVNFTLGTWLADSRLLGIEGAGFFLNQGHSRFGATSTTPGSAPLYIPIVNYADAVGEGSLIIGAPLAGYNGAITVVAATRFWGLESNALGNLFETNRISLVALAGIRFLDLKERLRLTGTSHDFLLDHVLVLQDQFTTQNQFFGGQLGARAEYRHSMFFANFTGKVALGATREILTVSGLTQSQGLSAPVTGSYPGGIFAQPSNSGRQENTELGFVPQLGVNVGLNLLETVRFQVGYEFLYWSSVIRPGDQLDRGINPTQTLGQTMTGAVRPLPLFNRSDFWAHGLNLGLLVQF